MCIRDRYDIGLDGFSRDGTMRSYLFDLQFIADLAEPGGVVVQSITQTFIRISGDMRIQLLNDGVTVPPTPDQPGPPAQPSGNIASAETVRFLNQTSFGATDETIAQVEATGDFGV